MLAGPFCFPLGLLPGGLLSPREQYSRRSGLAGKPLPSVLKMNGTAFLEHWTQPKACSTFPAGQGGWENEHGSASVPLYLAESPFPSPWSLAGATDILGTGMGQRCLGKALRWLGSTWTKVRAFLKMFYMSYFSH